MGYVVTALLMSSPDFISRTIKGKMERVQIYYSFSLPIFERKLFGKLLLTSLNITSFKINL